jgi:hypothetical protein
LRVFRQTAENRRDSAGAGVAAALHRRAGQMATQKLLDLRPGTLPEIRADGDRITYRLEIAGAQAGGRLIIRCDADGEIWASIDRRPSSRAIDNTD